MKKIAIVDKTSKSIRRIYESLELDPSPAAFHASELEPHCVHVDISSLEYESEADLSVSDDFSVFVDEQKVSSRVSSETSKLAADVRAKRNALLAESDWIMLADSPASTACKQAFAQYRQALRDIAEQEGFPTEVVWPQKPNYEKA